MLDPYLTQRLLGQRGGLTPAEIGAALDVSKQGAMDLLRPLVKAGLVRRIGTLKTGHSDLGHFPTLAAGDRQQLHSVSHAGC